MDHDCEKSTVCIPGDYCWKEHHAAAGQGRIHATSNQRFSAVPNDAEYDTVFGWLSNKR